MPSAWNDGLCVKNLNYRAEHYMTFEEWWESHGKLCRSGGGEYEKTFAFRAWEAAIAEYESSIRKMKEEHANDSF